MNAIRVLGFFVLITSLLLAGPITFASALPATGTLSIAPNLQGFSGTGCVSLAQSCDWAGYGVLAEKAVAVTVVSGTWTMPAGTCALTPTYAFFAVGIDGVVNNGETEQIGTALGCDGITASPIYFAWYEAFPSTGLKVISSTVLAVHSGDTFAGKITYAGTNHFVFSIKDTTTGQAFTVTHVVTYLGLPVARQSAEWVVETASQCSSYSNCVLQPASILPLQDFGSIYFDVCSATVLGTTGSIKALGGTALTMYASSLPPVVMASPASLTGLGGSFQVSLHNPGP